MNQQQPWLAGT